MAAAGDTLVSISQYVDGEVDFLRTSSEAFVNLLRDDSDVSFDVGNLDTLNYLQWDYNTDLLLLQAGRPAYLSNLGADAESAADQIAGLAVPAAPSLNLPTAAIPTLDAERPVITMPALPGTNVGDAPGDAPVLTEYPVPDAPVVTLPAVPTFEELQIPVAPTITLPTISSQMPANTLSPPTGNFSFVDAGYTSPLRDPLVAKLLDNLVNGGYGIEPADEAALWTRARDRAEVEGRLAVEAALKRASATSFPMPTGALYADLQRERAAVLKALSEANREIALKRSDLYVENRKFTIEQVQQYEKIAIDLYNAVQERMLNVAKATVELGIAVYDASVRNFNAQLEAFRTENQVFEIRVRAELAKAELYKAQIDAERLRGEFNRQRVELYQAQLNGIQSVVNLYKTRIDAVNALTQVQAQRVDIFRSRVSAYAERVRAKSAEYDMYRAAVSGEIAKLDIYKTDISAYETRVRAEESRTKVLLQGNEALLQRFRAQVDQYQAQLAGATKNVDARTDILRTQVAGQGVNVAVYRALTDAVLAGMATKKDVQRMNNDWNIAALNSHVDEVKFRLEKLKATMQNRGTIDQFGAKFYGDQLTALYSAINGLSVKSA